MFSNETFRIQILSPPTIEFKKQIKKEEEEESPNKYGQEKEKYYSYYIDLVVDFIDGEKQGYSRVSLGQVCAQLDHFRWGMKPVVDPIIMSGDWMQVGVGISVGRVELIGYVKISSDLVKILQRNPHIGKE